MFLKKKQTHEHYKLTLITILKKIYNVFLNMKPNIISLITKIQNINHQYFFPKESICNIDYNIYKYK